MTIYTVNHSTHQPSSQRYVPPLIHTPVEEQTNFLWRFIPIHWSRCRRGIGWRLWLLSHWRMYQLHFFLHYLYVTHLHTYLTHESLVSRTRLMWTLFCTEQFHSWELSYILHQQQQLSLFVEENNDFMHLGVFY